MDDPTEIRLHAIVDGRVQGVGYRFFVVNQAEKLNLNGWVRNTRNGNVEVVSEGSRARLEQFLAALYDGPPAAWVNNIDVQWLPPSGEFQSFRVEYTV